MSDGDRSGESEVGELNWRYVLAIFAAISIIWLAYRHHHIQEREKASAREQELAVDACVHSPSIDLVNVCISKAKALDYEQTTVQYDLKAQQDMAEWAFLATLLTGAGLFLLYRTLHATSETVRLAEGALKENIAVTLAVKQQLVADHPPRLKIIHIEANVVEGEKISGNVLIVNEGQSRAWIKVVETYEGPSDLAFFIGSAPPSRTQWRTERYHKHTPVIGYNGDPIDMIPAGGATDWYFNTDVYTLNGDTLEKVRKSIDGPYLYLIGRLPFTDENGNTHLTWFCRQWNPESDRFVPTNDHDFEFQT